MLGGSGAVESVVTICALREGIAPPTVNLQEPDDAVTAGGIHIATVPRSYLARRFGLRH